MPILYGLPLPLEYSAAFIFEYTDNKADYQQKSIQTKNGAAECMAIHSAAPYLGGTAVEDFDMKRILFVYIMSDCFSCIQIVSNIAVIRCPPLEGLPYHR